MFCRRCHELDKSLGDTATHVAEIETTIMIKLTNIVLFSIKSLVTRSRHR
jgi:hypothetical protein